MKKTQLFELARLRRSDRISNHGNIGDYHEGAYEADHVSPWSRSAHAIDAQVMIVAQDWAGHEYLSEPFRPYLATLGYDPALYTNINLQALLKKHLGMSFSETFATNAFPFVKAGGMSAGIPSGDFRYAAETYLLPQIRIVAPRLVICLGAATYNSLRRAVGLEKATGIDAIVESEFRIGDTRVKGVAHTGRLGTNQRGVHQVNKDWEALSRLLLVG